MIRARRARVLSKQGILHVHNDNTKDAKMKLGEANRLLNEMRNILSKYPEFERFDQISSAREEYAEASIMYGLKTSDEYPTPEEIGVPINAYLMGLGDVPGELRRQALDALRVGDLELAESRLDMMERIYLSLVRMEEATLLKGLRRKLDIARGLIERTRSEVTSEVGRRRLDESVKQLTGKLEKT